MLIEAPKTEWKKENKWKEDRVSKTQWTITKGIITGEKITRYLK